MQSSLLAQLRPSVTTPVLALAPTIRTEISRIFVCNGSGSAAAFSLYHDDDGTDYTDGTALFKAHSIAANSTLVLSADAVGLGIAVAPGGALAVQSSVASALTITIYGSTLNIAPQTRS